MLQVPPGVANAVSATLVAVADGSPITAGSVNFYLLALSGDDAGWWDGAEEEWSETEAVAASGAHQARGHWAATIAAAAWVEGTRYTLYAAESGGLDIPVSRDVLCTETLAAIKAKTDLITAGSVTVVSPTAADGTITVTRGDDTAISLEIPNYTGPSVTGAIAIFSIGRSPKGRPAIVTITAATAAMEGTSLVLTATLAADDTDPLTANTYLYDWQLTLAGGAIYTPARGAFIVNADVSQ